MSTEDIAVIRHVLQHKERYYEMLGVTSRATGSEIKLAYRKLALRLHPDKNQHPRAEDAFKLVNTANNVLSDAEKRKTYDMRGVEGVRLQESGASPQQAQSGRRYQQQRYRDPFETFVEEMLYANRRPRRAHPQQGHGHGGGAETMEVNPSLFLLLPVVLFFLLVGLLNTLSLESPPSYGSRGGQGSRRSIEFSLTLDNANGLVVERQAAMTDGFSELRVNYYVSRNSQWRILNGHVQMTTLQSLELDVLRSQRDYLERRCYADTLKRRNYARERQEPSKVCAEYERFRVIR